MYHPSMEGIIVILGSPNDEAGNLLSIAKERLDQGIKELRKHQGYKILLTGGYGDHFNKTNKPHAFYAKQYLMEKSIKDEDILEFAESSDTSEDAKLSKPIIEKYGVRDILVVTSNFHLERAKFFFKKFLGNGNLTFSASKTDLPEEQLSALRAHENGLLERLK